MSCVVCRTSQRCPGGSVSSERATKGGGDECTEVLLLSGGRGGVRGGDWDRLSGGEAAEAADVELEGEVAVVVGVER